MNKSIVFLVVVCTIALVSTAYAAGEEPFFVETFNEGWSRWSASTQEKFTGTWKVEEIVEGDKGLVVQDVAKHHAIVVPFETEFDVTDKDFFIQYEVKLENRLDCGGAYLKILRAETMPADIETFDNDTPYTIMFGPDKCGTENKVHFIFQHKNPLTGEYEEKHLTVHPRMKDDTLTHLYGLLVRTDNTFEIFIDQESVKSGSLLEDFTPSVNPPKEIDDPDDLKPEDWVDIEMIPDPEAMKPDDWDEDEPKFIEDPDAVKPDDWLDDAPEYIPDPEAQKPEDWDDEFDGEYEAPMVENPDCIEFGCGEWEPPVIANPLYKGKWSAPMIPNPLYKGPFVPKQIPNPDYFEDLEPHNMDAMGGIGIELWTMTNRIIFDNIIVTYDKEIADKFAEETWVEKYAAELEEEASKTESAGSIDFEGLLEDIRIYCIENPLVAVGTVVVAILPLIYLCMPRRRPASPAKKEEKEEKEEEHEQSKIENIDDDEDEEPTTKRRKPRKA